MKELIIEYAKASDGMIVVMRDGDEYGHIFNGGDEPGTMVTAAMLSLADICKEVGISKETFTKLAELAWEDDDETV